MKKKQHTGALRDWTPTAGGGATLCPILTTFNRRETTLGCLRALQESADLAQVSLSAVVVDDRSTDGTAAAIEAAFPWARVLHGDGDLFWCRGMHRAFAAALAVGHEHYLWLNDDTVLAPDALLRLFDCHAQLARVRLAPVIVVGATHDPTTLQPTYGGERIPSRWRPLRVVSLAPSAAPQRCDSMTGNIALVSAEVAALVGNLDPAFEHAMGDTDYALRARAAGVEIWLAPGVLGTCSRNQPAGTYHDATLPFSVRWRMMLSRKGLPWRSWFRLARRHGGLFWPLSFAWPYAKFFASAIGTATHRR
jgi:GT2 family glycosyltransferase